MKKKKQKTPDIVEMSCPVCTSCYREVREHYPEKRCHFGGPFVGYKERGK